MSGTGCGIFLFHGGNARFVAGYSRFMAGMPVLWRDIPVVMAGTDPFDREFNSPSNTAISGVNPSR